MKFLVKNVGKVKHAQIDVQGITVIAGYNNTGKTTILRSADVILKTNLNYSQNLRMERIKSIVQTILKQDKAFDQKGLENLPFQLLGNLAQDLFDYLVNKSTTHIDWEEFWKIYLENLDLYTEEIAKEEHAAPEILEDIAKEIYEQIEKIYERSDSVYYKYLTEINLRSVFRKQASNLLNEDASRIQAFYHDTSFRIDFQSGKVIEASGSDLGGMPVIYIETSNILDGACGNKGYDGSASDLKKLLQKERSYNREEISFEQYRETERNLDMLDEIFQEALHGRLQSQSDMLAYKEDSITEPIQIANVASGMKIFLALRRLIENGSLTENGWVLIDEPESNLHPQWHLKLAEILVLFTVKMNVHILLSSHSPYFIRALEVKLADYNRKDSGKFYLMQEHGNMFDAKDVTECTEEIYKQLYRPLELL